HPLNKEWGHYHNPIDKKVALDIIDILYESKVKNLVVKVSNSIYLEKHDDSILSFFKPTLNDYPLLIGNVRDGLKDHPTIMMAYPNEENKTELFDNLQLTYPSEVQIRNWGPPFHVLEIMRNGLSKAKALDKIAQYYQIPQDRVIAFG